MAVGASPGRVERERKPADEAGLSDRQRRAWTRLRRRSIRSQRNCPSCRCSAPRRRRGDERAAWLYSASPTADFALAGATTSSFRGSSRSRVGSLPTAADRRAGIGRRSNERPSCRRPAVPRACGAPCRPGLRPPGCRGRPERAPSHRGRGFGRRWGGVCRSRPPAQQATRCTHGQPDRADEDQRGVLDSFGRLFGGANSLEIASSYSDGAVDYRPQVPARLSDSLETLRRASRRPLSGVHAGVEHDLAPEADDRADDHAFKLWVHERQPPPKFDLSGCPQSHGSRRRRDSGRTQERRRSGHLHMGPPQRPAAVTMRQTGRLPRAR